MKGKLRLNRLAAIIAALIIVSMTSCASRTTPAAAAFEPVKGVALPIVMYHSIVDRASLWGTYVISPKELEDDLRSIKANGYTTVTVADLLAYVDGGAGLPNKPVMLTFDDGYYNNYLYAYPLLKKYGMKALLSIVGKYTDQYSLFEDVNPAYSHVIWGQVREMAESGLVEIQNHSYDMHTINKDRTASMKVSGESVEHYRTTLISDAVRLQALIDGYTGHIPEAYTYPYGLVSKDSVAILEDIGFRASLSCSSGINRITRDPHCLYLLKRLLRPHGKPVSDMLDNYK